VVVVGLIAALVAEVAGSIARRQLYRNRCKLIGHLDPKPDFGVAESILMHATATPGESPNSHAGLRTGAICPCYPLKIANRQEIYHEPPGY
jgi:hypothetical protein